MVVDPCNEDYAYLSLTVRVQRFGVGPPDPRMRRKVAGHAPAESAMKQIRVSAPLVYHRFFVLR